MSRIRTVKPEFFGHPKTQEVSVPARLMFIALWTEADDEGRLYDQPRRLEVAAFGDTEGFDGEKLLAELAQANYLSRYEACGRRLIQIHDWHDHQRLDHPRPSRLPAQEGRKRRERSGKPPAKNGTPPEIGGLEQGTGNREQGKNIAPKNGAVSGEIRAAIKNALAEEWTGGTTLAPKMWGRVEDATAQILSVGVGKHAEERGATLADIPAGLHHVHELWRVTNPGLPFPPQTASREWVRFLNGELEVDAEVAQDRADWIAKVRRRIA